MGLINAAAAGKQPPRFLVYFRRRAPGGASHPLPMTRAERPCTPVRVRACPAVLPASTRPPLSPLAMYRIPRARAPVIQPMRPLFAKRSPPYVYRMPRLRVRVRHARPHVVFQCAQLAFRAQQTVISCQVLRDCLAGSSRCARPPGSPAGGRRLRQGRRQLRSAAAALAPACCCTNAADVHPQGPFILIQPLLLPSPSSPAAPASCRPASWVLPLGCLRFVPAAAACAAPRPRPGPPPPRVGASSCTMRAWMSWGPAPPALAGLAREAQAHRLETASGLSRATAPGHACGGWRSMRFRARPEWASTAQPPAFQ
jgi:hypothetical protein